MKKIININLSGRVIPIEDSAYEKLQAYIESLRRYFSHEEGRDEIINDIESRIAELLHEKVRKGAASITDADVDEVAASMGRPEDFEAEAASERSASEEPRQKSEPGYDYSEKRTRGRLYRDTSDKFIGGVCSGIANYLNLDPAIIRILFAIVSFGGFGLGILLYVLLWVFLPTKDLEGFSGKRLYRNPDDRIIGGVAGGLAAYFNRRASTIRLIFAIPLAITIFSNIVGGFFWDYHFHFVPNIVFGSLTGTFILAYIILWMVLPEARSQYEKMEMRGETVDVNTIRQNVKEGMQNMKDRMKEWGQEVKESAQNLSGKAKEFASTRGKTFAKEAGDAVRRRGSGLGHAIGVLFKVFFLFIAGSIAFGLFVGLMVVIFGGIAWWPVNNFLWTSNWQQIYAWGTLIFFLGVPLIALITWVIRRILRVRSRSSYLGWIFGGLWVIGWIAATLFAASIAKDLRDYDHSDSIVNITQPAKGKMIVMVSEPELEYTGNFDWINDGGEGWDLSEDTLKLSAVKFIYDKSDDSLYHVTVKKFSAGRNNREAIERAEKIEYRVSYKDSVLDLGSGFAVDKNSKYRGQKIEIEIKIPEGRKIRFDQTVERKLNPVNIRVYRNRRWTKRGLDITFDDREWFPWISGVDYVMGSDGKLKDSNGNSVTNDFRYESNDSIELKKSIEQKKQELKELEEKQKSIESKPGLNKREKVVEQNDEDEVASSFSPVFTPLQWF